MLLYIHIPFCDSKCSYCAFNSYVDKFDKREVYMEALYKQLEFELKRFEAKKNSLETLFIGGGTPSTVAPALYEKIFRLLRPYFKENIEITCEANPNSATLFWLQGMRALGVNRMSFGVQSFNEEKLKLLNRAHNPKQAVAAVYNAKKAGFENISLDIIYATLGDTKELLVHDLQSAFLLPINHISAYALTIEEQTAFESKPHMSQEKLELTEWIFDAIAKKGFTQYEISNFGLYRSKHNLGYWLYKDYIGAGSGAVGKLDAQRFYPSTNLEAYINNPLNIHVEELSPEDIKIEKIFLGLRSCVGVKKELLEKEELMQAEILLQEHKLILKDDTFYNNNYLLADEIALFLTS